VEIITLFASPVHGYAGRPSDGPLPGNRASCRTVIDVKAGLGIVGDRYFNNPAHTWAAVTVMGIEPLERIAHDLALSQPLKPEATRRNIILRGVDIDRLRDATFSLDTGTGPVAFAAHRPANPCAWMDLVLTPGAHQLLRGGGGMRCEALTSGTLMLGPAVMRCSVELSAPAGVVAR
jgi:MOSC domain-containing protein YiiM